MKKIKVAVNGYGPSRCRDMRDAVRLHGGFIGPDGFGRSRLLGLIARANTVQRSRVEVLGGDRRSVQYRNGAGR